MKKSENKRERTETITNCKKCKTKQNSKNYKKNRKNKYEHCQLSRTNSVQQDENVKTQNYARNELTTTT